ncbi:MULTISPECIES: hypothetical protein [unclassified Sphingomonas]|uniref:hypothetical protein n=1 Tax=unclassified Sphingomonas TaxID=196159 RepID=UPI00083672BF|nr:MULTISPECIES: hypothetical protein [unclassified Sphingomonas]
MRKFITAAAAALIVATAAPAFARDTAPSAPQSSEASAPKAETRYCVSETPLGSRLPKKTCKTRAQWIADDNFDPLAPQR